MRLGVYGLGNPGIEEIGRLDGQILIAQDIADKMVGIPYLPAIRRIEFFRADFTFSVYPCGNGGFPGSLFLVGVVPGLMIGLHCVDSLPAALGIAAQHRPQLCRYGFACAENPRPNRAYGTAHALGDIFVAHTFNFSQYDRGP